MTHFYSFQEKKALLKNRDYLRNLSNPAPPLVLWLSRSCAGGTWLPQEQHSSFPAYHQHSQTQLWLLLLRPFTVPLTVQHKLRLHSIQACLLTQFQHLTQVHFGHECTYQNYIFWGVTLLLFPLKDREITSPEAKTDPQWHQLLGS